MTVKRTLDKNGKVVEIADTVEFRRPDSPFVRWGIVTDISDSGALYVRITTGKMIILFPHDIKLMTKA